MSPFNPYLRRIQAIKGSGVQLQYTALAQRQARRMVHDNHVVASGQAQTKLLLMTYFHADSESLLSEQVDRR